MYTHYMYANITLFMRKLFVPMTNGDDQIQNKSLTHTVLHCNINYENYRNCHKNLLAVQFLLAC